MEKNNFILINGEKLILKAQPKKNSGGERQEVYTFEESAERLQKNLDQLIEYINKLPNEAMPQNKVVFSLYVHPAYIAKSHFPVNILKKYSAKVVGSKYSEINPEKQLPNQDKKDTNVYYILISRGNLENFRNEIFNLNQKNHKTDIQTIEKIKPFYNNEKIKFEDPLDNEEYEIVLHSFNDPEDSYILKDLSKYTKILNTKIINEFTDNVDGLTFIHAKLDKEKIKNIADYTFIRAIRIAQRIRNISIRSDSDTTSNNKFTLNTDYIDHSLNVAIFDGGFNSNSFMNQFVEYEDHTISKSNKYINHGIGVTSACLFGHIEDEEELIPYSNIKNYKILEDSCSSYSILKRIDKILRYEDIEFINLSIGPNQTIEDDDVHYWTAVLDKHFSTGDYFTCIAAGNSNERVHVPSDCVNAMAIGSANSNSNIWDRAFYSNIGPGRSPGFIKPDGIAFGGDSKNNKMFYVFNEYDNLIGTQGTSFASPYVLRTAIGIKAKYGSNLLPITLKAILIHHAEQSGNSSQEKIGWGRFNMNIDDMMTCHNHEIKVLYQGKINVKEYYRAEIPLPDIDIEGMLKIKATFCFSSSTDAEHPPSYTNHGLVATFIPHSEKKQKRKNGDLSESNKTDSFFSSSEMYTSEQELRRDSQKWETVLHSEKRKQASGLYKPYFEIKYHERAKGSDSSDTGELAFSLILTIESEKGVDIFNPVQIKYANILEQIQPKINIGTKITL